MANLKTHRGALKGIFGRLVKARESGWGRGGSASAGYSSVVSFRLAEQASRESHIDHAAEGHAAEDHAAEDCGAEALFVAHGHGLMPRDPVARPALKPRLVGAAKVYQLCDEPAPGNETTGRRSQSAEIDIAAFVEVVSAAYPQPRDPDVRPVLKARPKDAARPFVYLPGTPGDPGKAAPAAVKQPAWDAHAIQQAHKERELKAFHEFLDRMESVPLEALDRPLAELDEKAEERRQFAAPPALYDPILEAGVLEAGILEAEILEAGAPASTNYVAREAPPLPEEDRSLIVEAVIEPQDPVAKPRLPQSPAAVLAGGVPQRLSPSQRAHLKRPVTLRDRHGRIAPVTYSLSPRSDA